MPFFRVQLEGIALGSLVLEADSEQDAIAKAGEDGLLNDLADCYDVIAVAAAELPDDALPSKASA